MDAAYTPLSTGLPGLDAVIQSVIPGDNIVWQVDEIDQYAPFVRAMADNAWKNGRPVVYFRFASHAPLLAAGEGISVHEIDLSRGFETSTTEIHRVIEQNERGTCFIFDCLSDLTTQWYSDLMLGNFFLLTCPLIYYLNSIAYFALFRNHHTFPVMATIRETTQLVIDVSTFGDHLYVQPLKVWQRNSPTMYLPHRWEGDHLVPVTDSATISRIEANTKKPSIRSSSRFMDFWDRTFLLAQEALVDTGEKISDESRQPLFDRVAGMLFPSNTRFRPLISKYLTLRDLVDIGDRLIGTGMIGSKTLGMLLGRAVLKKDSARWENLIEMPDSFYIGSDVFYSYLVRNGCWWVKKKQRDANTYLDDVFVARQNMLKGEMPAFIAEPFIEMLDYYGQSPIVVRASSQLDDMLGNNLSGIYESVFCVNQGERSERLEKFTNAIRKIYASAMDRDALIYRAEHGLLDREEQMAILVQRVSGTVQGARFFPTFSGVGVSPEPGGVNGEISLISGLGRNLSRLTLPVIRFDSRSFTIDTAKPTQESADVLNLSENEIETVPARNLPLPSGELTEFIENGGKQILADIRDLLLTLRDAFGSRVAIEFTVTLEADSTHHINLLQCRMG